MTYPIGELVNDDATLISRRCWTDPGVYALEKQGIFGKAWLFLGHESQIRQPGDFVQACMGETPIILSRGQDGQVYANINSCSHRGLPVCRADHGNTKRFICPYHNWSYTVEGDLATIPQESALRTRPDKSRLGLKRVPRVESWRGLVFGSFDAAIMPLETYLGDMRFYLDAFFERFPQGIEFMGAPHRWLLDANWKLPVENQLGDVNHGAFLHSAIIPREAQDLIEELGYSVVTAPGHGATFRLMPADAPVDEVAWGMEGMGGILGGAEVQDYLREVQARAAERVGPLRARMKGLTYGVYPNLSFLWSNTSFKVSHPRGPGKVEYWSWAVVPADAPESIKRVLRTNYSSFFGPGGILEQEDAEVWVQQFKGSNIDFADDRPCYYGLGLGEEEPHPDLPGLVSVTANEFYARNFFARWRDDLQAVEGGRVMDKAVVTSPQQQRLLEQFYYREARLLDNRQYQQWLALVTQDIQYLVPSRVNVQVDNRARGEEGMISVERELEGSDSMGCPIREESYVHLMLRVERAYKINSWSENPPARTRRIVGNVELMSLDGDEYGVLSNFHLYYARPGSASYLYSGQRRDVLLADGGEYRLGRREVILDYSDIDLPTLGLLF